MVEVMYRLTIPRVAQVCTLILDDVAGNIISYSDCSDRILRCEEGIAATRSRRTDHTICITGRRRGTFALTEFRTVALCPRHNFKHQSQKKARDAPRRD